CAQRTKRLKRECRTNVELDQSSYARVRDACEYGRRVGMDAAKRTGRGLMDVRRAPPRFRSTTARRAGFGLLVVAIVVAVSTGAPAASNTASSVRWTQQHPATSPP